jgi:hypothetical protein
MPMWQRKEIQEVLWCSEKMKRQAYGSLQNSVVWRLSK